MERIEGREQNMTARDAALAFCRYWFEQRDEISATEMLDEDVDFVGTGEHEAAHGKEEMSEYVRQDISEITEPFVCSLEVICEQIICEDACNLSTKMTLKNGQ